ncbi:MAG: MoaD/ThiS family protein [Deltaproteobacteria bacterium]|jgi:molybdopterin converting factor small subunit|nr:MoaD/ThiS family protein [Deltaproteobacteria bacterium]
MSVNLLIPTALRGFTNGQSQLELTGATVKELLSDLAQKHPDIAPHLFDETGAVRSFVNIFVESKNIKNLNGLDTSVNPGQTVTLVPSIAGGRS